ncbi:hypothetical protein CMUS01_16073 [Colletotrichum musicola]|uniref:Uncharacterized protein n=1 Tax=Colletotrichum musicola TaxID=2175873 RepID=A0A8H6IS45_9PEZI|nr:hypothetical protein CMUS01_16073 [Colletotrichum musicola]
MPPAAAKIARKPVALRTNVQRIRGDGDDGTYQSSSSLNEAPIDSPAAAATTDSIWRVWAFEVACIFLSILFFVGGLSFFFLLSLEGLTVLTPCSVVIVAVFFVLDEKPLPDWPSGFTLNSFLAFFATLAKASFMIPVSVAISQTQWAWLSQEGAKSRALYDLEIIDQASRGAWGSLVLLWRFRFRHVVVLGAALVAISALTAPITQLAINYPILDIPVTGEVADVQAVQDIRTPGARLITATRLSNQLAVFLDHTMFKEPLSYNDIAQKGLFCSTGNCTFDRYHSLGVCMKKANVSSYLRVEEFDDPEDPNFGDVRFVANKTFPERKAWKASLPGGPDFAHQSKTTLFTDILSGNLTYGFKDDFSLQQARIASLVLIYTNPGIKNKTWFDGYNIESDTTMELLDHIDEFRHEATEVLFYLCVHTHKTKVDMGAETNEVVESFTEPLEHGVGPFLDLDCGSLIRGGFYTCRKNQARWNDTFNLKAPSGSSSPSLDSERGGVFSADYHSMEDLAHSMRAYMTGYLTINMVPHQGGDYSFAAWSTEFPNAVFQVVLMGRYNLLDHELGQICLENIYQNVATSLSAALRGGLIGNVPFTESVFNVTGEARRTITHVRIAWPWVSLLAVEIALAALFLAITIFKQAGNGPESKFRDVKGSSLATLVALSADCRAAAGGGLGPVKELEKTAKTLRVRLEGGQIVLAEVVDEKSS